MQVHRRKSSKDEEEESISDQPTRTRLNSTPSTHRLPLHSSSPFRTSFQLPPHSRTRSVSGPFTPTLSSPLSSSFPSRSPVSIAFPTSATAPELSPPPASPTDPPKHARRHSRLHSRNLSIFFPRPGSLPQSAIAEDGGQELELYDEEAPPASSRPQTEKTQLDGFTFGGRPFPASSATTPSSAGPSRRGHHHKHSLSHNFFSFLEPGSQSPSPAGEPHTQPTQMPVSPWNPISPFAPSSAGPVSRENGHGHSHSHSVSVSPSHSHPPQPPLLHTPQHTSPSLTTPTVLALLQFTLGASLWVIGQQIGSLSCTGLGYWVVFDAMGVGAGVVLPGWLVRREVAAVKGSRFYGNARVETVAMFAQAIYLMFSAVYVCKETVEHLLLSAGESALTGATTGISAGDGHHHHRGDEDPLALGIEFPVLLTLATLLSVIFTAIVYGNHSKLVNILNNRIPIPTRIPALRSLSTTSPYSNGGGVSTMWWLLVLTHTLTNPYVAAQVCFCAGILCVVGFVNPADTRTADLALATLEAAVTFKLAYRASVVLGTVLMQTAPPRASVGARAGGGGGKMEAFLRTMREIERHHQVLHLAAPHIWQLTPALSSPSPSPYLSPYLSPSHPFSRFTLSPISATPTSPSASPSSDSAPPPLGASPSLIATLELHVRPDLADEEALELTQWAWARCMRALSSSGVGEGGAEAEVTVGIVKG